MDNDDSQTESPSELIAGLTGAALGAGAAALFVSTYIDGWVFWLFLLGGGFLGLVEPPRGRPSLNLTCQSSS
jgi:hypothetical protein